MTCKTHDSRSKKLLDRSFAGMFDGCFEYSFGPCSSVTVTLIASGSAHVLV